MIVKTEIFSYSEGNQMVLKSKELFQVENTIMWPFVFYFNHIKGVKSYWSNDVHLLESNSIQGVGIISWFSFCNHKFYNLYDKLVYRNLNCERNEDFLNKLDEFVHFSNRKKYKVSIGKLL